MRNNKILLSRLLFTTILAAVPGLTQEKHEDLYVLQNALEAQRRAERYEISRILQEEFPGDDFPALSIMTREQRNRHREGILEYYSKMEFGPGFEMYYDRHVHPSKWNDLQKIGIIKKLSRGQKFSYKDHALVSEVVIIGRVRKLIYHPERSALFHTSIVVWVDEWLRDDFALHRKYDEVMIKYESGPVEGGSRTSASLEPPMHIGEKLLLFLSRAGFVSSLVWNSEHYSYDKEDLVENAFVAIGGGKKYLIEDSKVVLDSKTKLSLELMRRGVIELVLCHLNCCTLPRSGF